MKKNLLLIGLVFATLTQVQAQWQHTTCTASSGSLLAAHEDTIFQATSLSMAVSRSIDKGASWTSVKTFFTGQIYAIGYDGSTVLVEVYPDMQQPTLFKSIDKGAHWVIVGTGLPGTPISTFLFEGNIVYAGTTGSGYYTSADKGDNWTAHNLGLTNNAVTAILQADFIGTDGGGLFLDDELGWGALNDGLEDLHVTALAGTQLFNSFAGTKDSGVYRFNGSSTKVNKGLDNKHVTALAMSGSTLFAGTLGGGVFMSKDNGDNWISINDGFSNLNTMSLVISNTNIYAGFKSNIGVWKRSLSDFGITSSGKEMNGDSRFTVYPNPVTDAFTISLRNTSAGRINISLTNLLGETVYVEERENMNSNYSNTINLKDVGNGIYFVHVRAGADVYTKKIVISRQ